MVITRDMLSADDYISFRRCVADELGTWAKAIVWSRIEYRAKKVNRWAIEKSGHWWWRVSLDEFAEDIGLSHTQLRRLLKELEGDGHIERVKHQINGFQDQTYSYRIVVADEPGRGSEMDTGAVSTADTSYEVSTGDTSSLSSNKGTQSAEAQFEDWYKVYPRKSGKGAARKAFKAALKKVDLATLDRGRDLYIARLRADGTEDRYVKHPSSWLNGECWDDDYGDVTLPGFDAWWAKVTEVGDVGEVSRLVGLTWQVPDVPDGVVPREFLSASRSSWLSEVEASVRSRWVTQFGDLLTGP